MTREISLMELYLIETLRAHNISDEKILEQVRKRDIADFAKYEDSFDFTQLYKLDETNLLEDILQNGYKVKFLTFPGLIKVLQLKFNKQANIDFTVSDFTISKLQLRDDEIRILQQILSSNWSLAVENSYVKIEPSSEI